MSARCGRARRHFSVGSECGPAPCAPAPGRSDTGLGWLVCGLLGPLAPSLRRPLPPPRPAPPRASLGHPSLTQSAVGNGPGQVGAHAQLGVTPDCRPSPTSHGQAKGLASGPQYQVPGVQVCPGLGLS